LGFELGTLWLVWFWASWFCGACQVGLGSLGRERPISRFSPHERRQTELPRFSSKAPQRPQGQRPGPRPTSPARRAPRRPPTATRFPRPRRPTVRTAPHSASHAAPHSGRPRPTARHGPQPRPTAAMARIHQERPRPTRPTSGSGNCVADCSCDCSGAIRPKSARGGPRQPGPHTRHSATPPHGAHSARHTLTERTHHAPQGA
jgi:hypothetical protein